MWMRLMLFIVGVALTGCATTRGKVSSSVQVLAAERVAGLVREGWRIGDLMPEAVAIYCDYRRHALVLKLREMEGTAGRVRVVEGYVAEMGDLAKEIWGRREVDADRITIQMTEDAVAEGRVIAARVRAGEEIGDDVLEDAVRGGGQGAERREMTAWVEAARRTQEAVKLKEEIVAFTAEFFLLKRRTTERVAAAEIMSAADEAGRKQAMGIYVSAAKVMRERILGRTHLESALLPAMANAMVARSEMYAARVLANASGERVAEERARANVRLVADLLTEQAKYVTPSIESLNLQLQCLKEEERLGVLLAEHEGTRAVAHEVFRRGVRMIRDRHAKDWDSSKPEYWMIEVALGEDE